MPTIVQIDGNTLLAEATRELQIDLTALVARSSIWTHPEIFRRVLERRPHAAWFPNCRRAWTKKGERAKSFLNGVHLDDNSKANLAIKNAIFPNAKNCRSMHVCHVWSGTCYDPRYHTSLANLVLLPAPLAGFSDHDEQIAAILRFRSYELYGWHPPECTTPERPKFYPSLWGPHFVPHPLVMERIERLPALSASEDI